MKRGVALVAAGLLCAAGAGTGWHAGAAGAAELFSFELTGGARGFNFFSDPAADGGLSDPGAAIGETEAALASGPVGLGLASVAWPGPIIANGGTLLLVVQPGCTVTGQLGLDPGGTPVCPIPAETGRQLNYPIRAEARTGQEDPEVTNDDVPGTVLTASATGDEVTADATVASADGIPGGFGNITAHSETRVAGGLGIAEARSRVQDIDIGGVIRIRSIVSTARAQTDGAAASGDGATTVTGMTIGGQPAYVDSKGLHIGTQGADPSPVTSQLADQALSQIGASIVVGLPTKEVEGSTATIGAPSLVISFEPPSDDSPGRSAIVFGGAVVRVTASQGDGGLLDSLGGTDVADPGGSLPGDTGAVAPGPVDAAVEPGPSADDEVALGESRGIGARGRPVRTGAVVLGVLAAALLAIGMKRLGDGVLAEQAGTTCTLEGGAR